MSITNYRVLSSHFLHVIPVVVLLWSLVPALSSRCSCVIWPSLLRFISSKASSRPQGKYMHHTHMHEDLLLKYILFARETHEHEGIFPVSTPFALMHIAKIHVTHCLLYHAYAFSYSYDISWHDCIHVGGANACCMSFQSFTCYFSSYPYLKIWCCHQLPRRGRLKAQVLPRWFW